MKNHYNCIDKLISLYLSQRASEEEIKELEEWISKSSHNREVFDYLQKIWNSSSTQNFADKKQERDLIWAAGTGQLDQKKVKSPQKVASYDWWMVAAIFLLVFTGVWIYGYLAENNYKPEEVQVTLVKKENPAGRRSIHVLPDGTKVWLNTESTLIYPEKFNDTIRLVKLEGEAFFEVAKEKQKPFIVESKEIRTMALGTSFNISCYADSQFIKISLLEGKASVNTINKLQTNVLSPGEELWAQKDNGNFSKKLFDYENTFGWKEGTLIFDGADFNGFKTTVERWYGVKIEISGTPPSDWSIRSRYHNENLTLVLRDICFNKNIKFEIKDKTVLLTF